MNVYVGVYMSVSKCGLRHDRLHPDGVTNDTKHPTKHPNKHPTKHPNKHHGVCWGLK